jgi:dihydrofolate synthase/folylpolyglutamate synthase
VTGRDWLFSLEQFGVKLGLAQIRGLLETLQHPQRAFASVVVAGTNGKGSVAAMVERGLRAAGYRTGRYTSPHLVDLEERCVIDGQAIAARELEGLAARIRTAAGRLPAPPTFFEATTALTLEAFREAGVQAAVLEVGLGGRLDATNAVDARCAVITSVDFDHEEHLGHTLTAIAREKAGVIKPGALVVLGDNAEPVRRVVRGIAAAEGAHLVEVNETASARVELRNGRTIADVLTRCDQYNALQLSLRGRHQVTNALTALVALEALDAGQVFGVPREARRVAVEDATWPARLELLRWQGGEVLIDGAHNPAGARALAAYLQEVYGRPVPIVLGVMRDKKATDIVRALSGVASAFVCTAARSPRALPPHDLAAVCATAAPAVPTEAIVDPAAAVAHARALGSPVAVAGSLYLAGEVRAVLA